MDGHNTQKSISFDLDTNALKEYYCQQTGKDYTQAYSDIRNFMAQNGFIHRQGSEYNSINPLSKTEVTYLTMMMAKEMPWLILCIKEIDVTDIRKQHSLVPALLKFSQQSSEQIIDQYSAGISSVSMKKICGGIIQKSTYMTMSPVRRII